MVFLPFVGALLQAVLPASANRGGIAVGKWAALGASIASSVCGMILVFSMRKQTAEMQAVELIPWVGSYAISYEMAVDGINALLILLMAIIFPLLISAEWEQKAGSRGMHGLLLILQTALLGAVCAQDLFLMFFFWSMSILPFYFLIGIWGGPGKETAAFRTIVAGAAGNALFFGALLLIYYSVDPHTFSLKELSGGKLAGKTFLFLGRELQVSSVAFGLVCAGLALRAPVWPIHGWFTHAAEEAPASVFVAMSAAAVPVAAGLFMRLSYSLFPETVARAAQGIVIVGIVNLVMGGLCAMVQRGLRLLLAFICLSGVGFILMGIGSLNPIGVVGATYQQLVLGLGVAGFGLFYGIVFDRTGGTEFADMKGSAIIGGIAPRAPAVALVAGLVIASILGFPGMGGFVGQTLLMVGSYSIHPVAVIIAGVMILLATYYLFMMYRYIFLGKQSGMAVEFIDLTVREKAYFVPLVASLLLFGLYPKPFIELVRPTALTLLSTIK